MSPQRLSLPGGKLQNTEEGFASQKALDAVRNRVRTVRLECVSAAEEQRFVDVVTDFVEEIKKLGPSPLKETLGS